MSRPFEATQQFTGDCWREVEQGVHVTTLSHLTDESRFDEEALLKLIRGGGVVVKRKTSDEVEARDDTTRSPLVSGALASQQRPQV